MAEGTTGPVRVWIKENIGVIQVSAGGKQHTASFTPELTVYDYEGEPYLLQAVLATWSEHKSTLTNKFELEYQELVEKSKGWI